MPKKLTAEEQPRQFEAGLETAFRYIYQQLRGLHNEPLAARYKRLRGPAKLYATRNINAQLKASAELGIRPKQDVLDNIVRYSETTEFR